MTVAARPVFYYLGAKLSYMSHVPCAARWQLHSLQLQVMLLHSFVALRSVGQIPAHVVT
jgi:hypothetical protein